MSQIIMVVANHETLLHSYYSFLTSEGYQVYTQNDFGSGYSTARVVEPRLIVVDMLMDDAGEGLELVEQLRAEASPFVNTPLILSSIKNRFNSGTETKCKLEHKIRLIPRAFDTGLILAAVVGLLAEAFG